MKTIVIVVGKLTRSRILWGGVGWGGAGLCKAPKGRDEARKFSPSCGARRGWGKIKPCGVGAKTPSFGPATPHFHSYVALL